MRFIGGKHRIAPIISKIIMKRGKPIFIEPFCGALNVTVEVIKQQPNTKIFASDLHDDLIYMWKEVQNGWTPPKELTYEQYHVLKNEPSSPIRTFAGYGCSFSGKWFGGYAQDKTGRNYCLNAYNSIVKNQKYIKSKNIHFSFGNYHSQTIHDNSVVYCDPPYINTTQPGTRNPFVHIFFWEWVRKLKVPCYVSEYVAPSFMQNVMQINVKTDMHTKSGKEKRIEKLFWNQI